MPSHNQYYWHTCTMTYIYMCTSHNSTLVMGIGYPDIRIEKIALNLWPRICYQVHLSWVHSRVWHKPFRPAGLAGLTRLPIFDNRPGSSIGSNNFEDFKKHFHFFKFLYRLCHIWPFLQFWPVFRIFFCIRISGYFPQISVYFKISGCTPLHSLK